MEFTGRATMRWADRQIDDGQTFYIGPVRMGFAYPLTAPESETGYRWGLYNAMIYGLADTLEEAKSALLTALGITVEAPPTD